MNKAAIAAIVAVAFVFVAVCTLGVIVCVKGLPFLRGQTSGYSPAVAQVSIPKDACEKSLVVFNFRPHGSGDTKYYAIGFARALADRTYCAPHHVTQQMSVGEISGALCRAKIDPGTPISDDLALKLAKRMGVNYAITGDVTINGSTADISVCVMDTRDPKQRCVSKISGDIAALPQLQTKAVQRIISAMEIKGEYPELQRPNFTKSETLKLYGQSYLTNSAQQTEALRWKAVDSDPGASFAVIRLLEYCNFGPSCCADLRNDKRLAGLLKSCQRDNSHIGLLRAMILCKESEYADAEKALRKVIESDHDMIWPHASMAYVAQLRQNGQLAVAEAKAASEAWPKNPIIHGILAESYFQLAASARHGHYYSQMGYANERTWRESCENSLKEAYAAIKLDPTFPEPWFCVMNSSLQLHRQQDRDRAYQELTRLTPTNPEVYTAYAFCFTPQWGGQDADQEQIFLRAEKAFPKGSYKPLYIRAMSMCDNTTSNGRVNGPWAGEILRLADEVSAKAGADSPDAVQVRFQAYELNRKRDDLLKLSEYAFKKWGGLQWQYRVGMGCALTYERTRNPATLERARQLFADYEKEIPFDPRGYIQTGWCLSFQGKRAEAKAQFLKALEIDPDNEVAREKLQYVQ